MRLSSAVCVDSGRSSSVEPCLSDVVVDVDDVVDSGLRSGGGGGGGREPTGAGGGDAASMETIFVKDVKDGGPASVAGLKVGDRVVMVNNQDIVAKSYAQVVALIKTRYTPLSSSSSSSSACGLLFCS